MKAWPLVLHTHYLHAMAVFLRVNCKHMHTYIFTFFSIFLQNCFFCWCYEHRGSFLPRRCDGRQLRHVFLMLRFLLANVFQTQRHSKNICQRNWSIWGQSLSCRSVTITTPTPTATALCRSFEEKRFSFSCRRLRCPKRRLMLCAERYDPSAHVEEACANLLLNVFVCAFWIVCSSEG